MLKSEIRSEQKLTVLKLSGYLDFGAANPVAEVLQRIYAQNGQAQVVVDMQDLQFVGSSGVSTFVKLMRNFNGQRIKPRYLGVKSEFLKLFRLFEEREPFELSSDISSAVRAFDIEANAELANAGQLADLSLKK